MGLFDRLGRATQSAAPVAPDAEGAAARLVEAGNTLEDAGRVAEALERYDEAARLAPRSARPHVNRGNALLALGRAEAATAAYRAATEVDPTYPSGWFNLGNCALLEGDTARAVANYERVLALRSDFPGAKLAMGHALLAQREFERALGVFEAQIDDGSATLPAYAGRGDALLGLRRFDEAQRAFSAIIEHVSADVPAHVGLGTALRESGQLIEARAVLEHAVARDPSSREAHYGLGLTLHALGEPSKAKECLQRALGLDTEFAECHDALGNVRIALGEIESGVLSYRRAVQLSPSMASAWSNLGNALLELGRPAEAEAAQRRALELEPELAQAHCNLGNTFRDQGRYTEAVQAYERAAALAPTSAIAHASLGNALKDVGSLSAANTHLRRAFELDPEYHQAFSSYLFCLSHDHTVEPSALLAAHREFGIRYETPRMGARCVLRNDRNPERILRIGVVSADLRDHPVAYFFEPVLRELSKDASIELVAYSNHANDDAKTLELRAHFAQWHKVLGMSDGALCERIVADRIDVLVDLSGHTSGNRLLALAHRPAPIQLSWMGYPGTTGLESIDYYIADGHFLPLAPFSVQFTEQLVHLPASAPFRPHPDSPDVSPLPALTNGFLTFGSFNRLAKVQPAVVALWCEVLRAIPGSRLLLGALPRDGQLDHLLQQFASGGIARPRIDLHPRGSMGDYLALHHHVDICLDTFPYTGGTTTTHALWMGVPTLTCAGATPASRQGAAFLGQVGLEEYVATSPSDFCQRAIRLASKPESIARTRAELRARCGAAAMLRPEWIAEGFLRAARVMFRRWCDGVPPAHIDVRRRDV